MSAEKSALRRLADGALALIYPPRARCMGCDSQAGCLRDWLCEDCRVALARRWVGAESAPPPLAGMAFGYIYSGPASGMVRHMKYGGVRQLARPMAAAMVRAWRMLQPTAVQWVTFVPMHPARQRRRGFNHAEALAHAVAEALALPCVDALTRTRSTPQQARLSDVERRRNLKGAFAAKVNVEGARILLVDDVYTTGATAAACAEALMQAGAQAVYMLCFARSVMRVPDGEAPPEGE